MDFVYRVIDGAAAAVSALMSRPLSRYRKDFGKLLLDVCAGWGVLSLFWRALTGKRFSGWILAAGVAILGALHRTGQWDAGEEA